MFEYKYKVFLIGTVMYWVGVENQKIPGIIMFIIMFGFGWFSSDLETKWIGKS